MTTQEPDKYINIIGWIATATSIGMYISYIPQIMDNLAGTKGNPVQPIAAVINCSLWFYYGMKRKDYPLAAANMPGIIFGAIAAYTAWPI